MHNSIDVRPILADLKKISLTADKIRWNLEEPDVSIDAVTLAKISTARDSIEKALFEFAELNKKRV